MNIRVIRERVRQECLRDQNVLGPSFLDEHLDIVAQYGAELAKQLGGDPEIVKLAAYLHDISAVRDISTLATHAAASAEIAQDMLRELACPADMVGRVVQCIRMHSTPIPVGCGTVEEVCLSNADAVAQIVRPAFWFYFAYGVRNMSFEEGRRWLRERKQSNWAAMIMPARKMATEGFATYVDFLHDFERPLSDLHA